MNEPINRDPIKRIPLYDEFSFLGGPPPALRLPKTKTKKRAEMTERQKERKKEERRKRATERKREREMNRDKKGLLIILFVLFSTN